MQQIDSTGIGAAEVAGGIKLPYGSNVALNGGQFVVQPVIEVFSDFLYRQVVHGVRLILERSLVPQVGEIPVEEGTEETYLCAVEFIRGVIGPVGGVLQIEVAEQHVEAQTLVGPLLAFQLIPVI